MKKQHKKSPGKQTSKTSAKVTHKTTDRKGKGYIN